MRKLPILLTAFLLFLPAITTAKELPNIAVWDLGAGNPTLSYAQDLTSILVGEISRAEEYEVYSQENVRTLAARR